MIKACSLSFRSVFGGIRLPMDKRLRWMSVASDGVEGLIQKHKLIDGVEMATSMRLKVVSDVEALKREGVSLKLISVTFGDSEDGPARRYVRNQKRVAKKCGIQFEELILREDISTEAFTTELDKINKDPTITGVIMQRPFPGHLCVEEIQQCVHPLKDVEGMHPESIGNVIYGQTSLAPCTAKAAVACLKSTGLARNGLKGMECVVIGHSEIVGKPISFLLMDEGATVSTCHHMTKDVTLYTKRADAVFIAVGKRNLVTGEMLKPGAAVIDVGINPVKDEQGKSTIVGDAEFDSCLDVAGWSHVIYAESH